jgi:chaperonin cofactor prefoldin
MPPLVEERERYMSETEARQIESTLAELEERIQARLGRWAMAIMGTCIVLAVGASSQWFNLISRVDRLESERSDRDKVIDDFSMWREDIVDRFARLEEGQKQTSQKLEAIQSAINAMAARR